MTRISTLTGPIDSQDLGFTLMHEHLFVLSWSMRSAFPGWLDRQAVIDGAVRALSAVHASGVDTILDCTAINLGRDIAMMREVADRSEVRVIASGGVYWTEEPWLDSWEPDPLFDWLMKDLDNLEGTGLKPGVIKCGTDRFGITPLNEKLLRVTARMHRATGLPITTHTTVRNRSALDQLDLFASEGVDLTHVVIGHCGDTDDMAMLEAILKHGCCIGMDRFRPVHMFPTEKRVKVIAELCKRGYASQMVLSHDTDVCSDFGRYKRPSASDPDAFTRTYCYVPDVVVPALRAAGVTEAQIHQMTVDNPRRVLTG